MFKKFETKIGKLYVHKKCIYMMGKKEEFRNNNNNNACRRNMTVKSYLFHNILFHDFDFLLFSI